MSDFKEIFLNSLSGDIGKAWREISFTYPFDVYIIYPEKLAALRCDEKFTFFNLNTVMTQAKKRRFWMNILVFRKSGLLESNLWLKIKLIFLFILGEKMLQALSILFNRMEDLGSCRPSILTLVLKVVKIITSTKKDFLFDFLANFEGVETFESQWNLTDGQRTVHWKYELWLVK